MTTIIQQSFKVALDVLSIFGLYTSGNNSTVLKVRAYALYFSLLVLGTSLILANLILKNDVSGMQMNLMVTYVAETTTVGLKVLPFFRNGERIHKCINFFGRRDFAPKDKQEKKIIAECISICRRNCLAYFWGVVSTATIWSLPVFFTKERTFPLQLWLPYDSISSDVIYYVTLLYIAAGNEHVIIIILRTK